tara:strand:- start:897 stop:1106 length:210 start_codon:yes stop_codon:yes gene_type:complete
MVEVKEFTKHITISVPFKTNNIGFGGGHLSYMGSKTYGNTKEMQKQDIISQLKENVIQLQTAITKLEEE